MSTPYHSKLFAIELTRQCSAHESDKLNRSILNATVDLNPHQIDAALFAFRSSHRGIRRSASTTPFRAIFNARTCSRSPVHNVPLSHWSVDIRSALVEEFRDRASIMVATESGAEGINLQFCSLVVNYDLPWNPQRIEQRIGRCHRYGQTSSTDVGVEAQAISF